MSNITKLIKELREKTGAGFLDCKKSLEENNNDIEKSIEALRKKCNFIDVNDMNYILGETLNNLIKMRFS